MTSAVIYARVSSKEQEREGYSIPAQLELFRDYAAKHGLTIVKEFAESESAKASGRKLFSEMIRYVEENKVSAVLFEKVDRMTRNFKDLILIYDLMDNSDVKVHVIKNSLILDKKSKSQDKFQLDIHVVLARNYINNLSEEVKKGMRQKKLQGGWPHLAPYGYDNKDSTVVLKEQEAAKVKMMFKMALGGSTLGVILAEMKKSSERKWHKSLIHRILTNPFYSGYVAITGEVFKGTHEAIVTPQEFEAVQKRLDGRDRVKDALPRKFRFAGRASASKIM